MSTRKEIRIEATRKPTWVAMAMLAGCCCGLAAQNAVLTGALAGRVVDQSGAVTAGAAVQARSLATGVEQSTVTNRAGLYRFPSLMPGGYAVRVSLEGFREAQDLLQVQVGATTLGDFRMMVGAGKESVAVSGRGPALRPAESSIRVDMDQAFLSELPLNGRRYTDFVTLAPNTSLDGDTGLVSLAGQQGGEDTGYANGNGSNAFTVDGSNATNNYFSDILGRYRIPYLYGEDAIQEFQVAISPYSALYGGGAGFVNAVTRSGGNRFHGSAFYYNRNSATGANDSIDKSVGNGKPEDALQQFGAGVGGPILKNRWWFFIDYEQQLRSDPLPVINTALTPTSDFLANNFGIPAGTTLPSPNGPLPVPGTDTAPDSNNPVYLQQVANAVYALSSNLGTRSRHRNDIVVTPRIDGQLGSRDSVFASVNYNRFESPGGVITVPTVGNYGLQTLASSHVRTFGITSGWTHTFSSRLLNEFHASHAQDNESASRSGLTASDTPTIVLDSPAAFIMGNAAFSIGKVFERQYSVADRVDFAIGRHTLQFGFDWNWSHDADTDDGGADPNEAIDRGSPLGLYEFSNLEAFALGEYSNFSQAAGSPTYSFSVPYYGFYLQDAFRARPDLTLELGLREDFQVYPQPKANPAFPLTGQFPNRYNRLGPRLGFAWEATPETVLRGGFGLFQTNFNGLNYRNAVISNGLPSQLASASTSYTSGAPNGQAPTFPRALPANSPLFDASDISIVSPSLHAPTIMQASLEIEREILENTTLSIGTLWSHGVHLLSGSAYDLNLQPLQGTTTYILCPPTATTAPCTGRSVRLPTMDSGLLSEGRINANLGQINALISPAQNHYNSLFVELRRRRFHGLALEGSYTFAKSIMLHGMDFNNQFDFSNTHAPSLQDQRHRIALAAVYEPHMERFTHAGPGRAALSGWRLSTVMEFSSGRPYAGLLSPACTSSTLSFSNCDGANDNLNDTAYAEDTANTAGGINGAGPTPGIGLNSFYGPWLQRVDMGLERTFTLAEGKTLELQAQAFNLANHANYYVQNGNGINQIQLNPIGSNCGDGASQDQTCYLVPNSGAGNFGTLTEINANGLPRVFQFSARFSF